MSTTPEPTYDLGDRRKLIVEVRNEDGDLADPNELSFMMREPDNELTVFDLDDPELVNDSVGIYHVYWDCVQFGRHYWRYAATGAIAAAEESVFNIRVSKVLPDGLLGS